MATESMKDMNPEDLKQAAEQLKHTRPEEMAQIGEKMANASPEEIAAMLAQADARFAYQINAAQMLKKGMSFIAEEVSVAKNNLKEIPSSKGRALLLACSLNLMSCYLKTNQYEECIKEENFVLTLIKVLAYDATNIKALYRRGQAYRDLGLFEDAVSDLSKAHEDETIADVLRYDFCNANKERLAVAAPGKTSSSGILLDLSCCIDDLGINTDLDGLQALRDDPEAIRTFQNFISKTDPDTLAALSGGKAGDMFKTASSMIGKMSPEDIQKMVQTASSFKGDNPFGSTAPSAENGFTPTPDMLKLAFDMMNKMSPEERERMFYMASSLKANAPVSTSYRDTETAELREASGESSSSMFTSMIKNMNPEMMASMSEQFGMKLSREDAAKAQEAMASLSSEALDTMMRWVDRAHRDRESEESKEVVARERRVDLCSMYARFSNGPSSSWLYWKIRFTFYWAFSLFFVLSLVSFTKKRSRRSFVFHRRFLSATPTPTPVYVVSLTSIAGSDSGGSRSSRRRYPAFGSASRSARWRRRLLTGVFPVLLIDVSRSYLIVPLCAVLHRLGSIDGGVPSSLLLYHRWKVASPLFGVCLKTPDVVTH
ncbi:hypothetical protein DY000_02057427, partial [Brassica cretica]